MMQRILRLWNEVKERQKNISTNCMTLCHLKMFSVVDFDS